MKKILLVTALAIGTVSAFAQKFDNVRNAFILRQFENAKKEIDKNLADAKYQNLPMSYLWKAKVYAELSYDEKLKAAYPNASREALDAFSKYRQLDAESKLLKEDGDTRFLSILYLNNYNTGQKFFSDKKYDSAFFSFATTEIVGDYLSKNGLTPVKQNIDTASVAFAGYSAQNAKRTDDALRYYQKLAGEKINAKEYIDVYRYMIEVYSDKKDAANFNKYLTLGRELYPSEKTLWNEYEANYNSSNLTLAEMMEKFVAGDKAGKLSTEDYVSYGQAFGGGMREDVAKLDSMGQATVRKLAGEAFRKAFASANNGIYAYNAGIMAYGEWSVLDDRYNELRGTSADLKAKREAVEKLQLAAADQAIEWMEKAYNVLKAKEDRKNNEKSSLNKSVDFLANLYQWKRDKQRGKDPKAYDALDVKYKQFDAEHNKY